VRRDSVRPLDAKNSSLGHKIHSSSAYLSSFLASYLSFWQCRSGPKPIPIKTRNQLLIMYYDQLNGLLALKAQDAAQKKFDLVKHLKYFA
jgi:hypothetical protein